MSWTEEQLDHIAHTDELEIASRRRDGSLNRDRTIWVVRHGGSVFVRSVYGRGSAWFRGTQTRHEGHIHVGPVDCDVTFVERDDEQLNEAVDGEYRLKYRRYATEILDAITGADARATTIELIPAEAAST